jgi:hypothetical protein
MIGGGAGQSAELAPRLALHRGGARLQPGALLPEGALHGVRTAGQRVRRLAPPAG